MLHGHHDRGGSAAAAPARGSGGGVVMALVAMSLAVFVLANDFSALNVALPHIEHDFDADVNSVQWVINAYALVFGMLIVTGGRLADLFGRRRMFFVGSAIFAGFSLIAGAAPNVTVLIAARALMGIGGAMMWPAILGMTYAALPAEKAGFAGGLILGMAGLGNAVGPLLGGALTDELSWRWLLYLNGPIAAFAMIVTWLKVHQPPVASDDERIDYAGIVTLSVALVALLVALDQVSDWSWGDARIVALLATFTVLLAAFVAIERRAGRHALVPPDMMANVSFTAACAAILLMSATFFAAMLYLPQFMQKLLGYSALKAGLGLLPMMAVFAIVSFAAGQLYDRIGVKPLVAIGAGCIAAGPFLLSLVNESSGYTALVPGMAILGLGLGLFYATATTAAVTSAEESRRSLAGGLVYMFQIAGGSIGLGLTTTIFTSGTHVSLAEDVQRLGAHVPDAQQNAIHGILAGTEPARQALSHFTAHTATQLELVVRKAFVAGFHSGFLLDAGLSLAGFALAVLFVGGRLWRRQAR